MLKTFSSRALYLLFFVFGLGSNAFSAGEVYLVIGSDTAIWSGMNTGKYNCTYNQSLYTDPTRNAYIVMNPSFRADLVDSYGQTLKMTWWMMAGNIFRYATNTNIPVPNIMTLYLMKKYHGDEIQINGDELSLHYHTFFWSDYDQDGIFYWNQSKTFLESKADFNVTLAQFLLEEQVFPVSFRSGWHYMDNDWQNYLDDRILPYSMHNDYPHKKTSDPEPIDNIYDWSEAPSAFVPYRPSRDNYQRPGSGPGWEVRSASFWGTRVNDYMDTVFAAANKGPDQVACFWSHLPQTDFPDNIQIIDSLAHRYAQKYPDVKFRYCTAIEAMQRWRKNQDHQSPGVSFTENIIGNDTYFNIETDEDIFQKQPFVAVKNINEDYIVLDCVQTGTHSWTTLQPVSSAMLVKAGVTVCDSLGNQTMKFITYLPDDAFIDNVDSAYNESVGTWSTSSSYAWGIDSRFSILNKNDSASASWSYTLQKSGYHNIFIQFPDIANRAEQLQFVISNNQQPFDTINVNKLMAAKRWNFLTTINAQSGAEIKVEMSASGRYQSGKTLSADVLKITPIVRERDLDIKEKVIDFGAVSEEDTAHYMLSVTNRGILDLHILSLKSKRNLFEVNYTVPFSISPMSSILVPLSFVSSMTGVIQDTLEILSDDPINPQLKVKVSAEVMQYFHTIDNEDVDEYEEFGSWHNSVANIYGPTSRYAGLNARPLASARFHTQLRKSGIYNIQEIVPSTVNSTDDALYEIWIDGTLQTSYHVDQNIGSGKWVTLGSLFLPAKKNIELWLKDTGKKTKGDVIRTDAVRFSLAEEGTAIDNPKINGRVGTYLLQQNYPNPFNVQTVIAYQIPLAGKVKLSIFNELGQKITTLVNRRQNAGWYIAHFDGSQFASGIYYYRISSGAFQQIRKMILIK